MELSRKTTILFSPDLHDRLARLAEVRGTSLGALVRDACRRQHDILPAEERIDAVRDLEELRLPVGTPREMEDESVPPPGELGG